jgi:hypothetical protein
MLVLAMDVMPNRVKVGVAYSEDRVTSLPIKIWKLWAEGFHEFRRFLLHDLDQLHRSFTLRQIAKDMNMVHVAAYRDRFASYV